MKAQRKFLLFVSVETQRRRRILVISFYTGFVTMAAVALWLHPTTAKYIFLLPLCFYMAWMLGGIMAGGPVRPFSQRVVEAQAAARQTGGWPISLGLSSVRRAQPEKNFCPLIDEHDIQARDRAHFMAYSALRWPIIVVILAWPIWHDSLSTATAERLLLYLAIPFVALFLSLPQAIILWTEPDLEPDPQEDPAPAMPQCSR